MEMWWLCVPLDSFRMGGIIVRDINHMIGSLKLLVLSPELQGLKGWRPSQSSVTIDLTNPSYIMKLALKNNS